MLLTIQPIGAVSPPLPKARIVPLDREKITYDLIYELFNSNDPEIRFQAVEELSDHKDENVEDFLIKCLEDENPQVVCCASSTLGYLKSKKAVDSLISCLEDENDVVCQYAACALGRIQDEKAVPFLSESLGDKKDEVSEQAAYALAEIRTSEAISALISVLSEKKYGIVRKFVAQALASTADKKAVGTLVSYLDKDDEELKKFIVIALGSLEDEESKNDPLWIKFLELREFSGGETYPTWTFNDVGIGNKRASFSWLNCVKSSFPEVRAYSAFALGYLRDKLGTKALISMLRDEDSSVRCNSAWALGMIKDERAVEPLIDFLCKEETNESALHAAWALSNMENPKVVVFLIRRLVNSIDNGLALTRISTVLGTLNKALRTTGLVEAFEDDEVRKKYLTLVQLGILAP